ncbi:MAG: PhnD/SsuA/transferrin family substrate-binding protein [Bosea sp.]|uniref:substrate-binding domain-containing protein n=1 Tax=Bosea sp. (in: a-proteobacteria) TaxID=1871050 RepID=UPI002394A7CB|nr:PhnD/SsuA/transferrin family substrate-binding protein [Bosea sp. (in: a-proteobacteria)]MCP4736850.1 PhnD/SsuA/transferrin family substrate-binding protein [Bosea sp. (in: a-proteobacteria)]
MSTLFDWGQASGQIEIKTTTSWEVSVASRVGRLSGSVVQRRALTRRAILIGASSTLAAPSTIRAEQPFRFGLTPVFLTSDLELLEALQHYLSAAMNIQVQLVLKRTYQEITSQLISGLLDAAWICGFPFVAYRRELELVAIPVWRGKPNYQSYLLVSSNRDASSIADLRGDIHAFSDPDSNSGYLVTRALLAERRAKPQDFFRRTFFTYGHRNVVRAVAAGLAQSGSVDGYVWEVMTETEPELTLQTRPAWRSPWMGFPPIATSVGNGRNDGIVRLRRALIDMPADQTGRDVLGLLRLDGFTPGDPALFDSIASRVDLVRALG